MKKCRTCSVELLSGDNWTPGYAERNYRICRSCVADYMRERYHRQNPNAKPHAPKATTPEERKARVKEIKARYWLKHRERILADGKAQRAALKIPALQAALTAAIQAMTTTTPETNPGDK